MTKNARVLGMGGVAVAMSIFVAGCAANVGDPQPGGEGVAAPNAEVECISSQATYCPPKTGLHYGCTSVASGSYGSNKWCTSVKYCIEPNYSDVTVDDYGYTVGVGYVDWYAGTCTASNGVVTTETWGDPLCGGGNCAKVGQQHP